jgi:hypothetical protein
VPAAFPVITRATKAVAFVCLKAVPVQPALVADIGMEGFSNAPDASTVNGAKSAFRLGKTAVSTRRANR